jgi:hypothetical protein
MNVEIGTVARNSFSGNIRIFDTGSVQCGNLLAIRHLPPLPNRCITMQCAGSPGKTHQNAKQIMIRKRNPKGLFIKTNQEENCLLVVHKAEYFIYSIKRAFLPG